MGRVSVLPQFFNSVLKLCRIRKYQPEPFQQLGARLARFRSGKIGRKKQDLHLRVALAKLLDDRLAGLVTVEEAGSRQLVYDDSDEWYRIVLPKLKGLVSQSVPKSVD